MAEGRRESQHESFTHEIRCGRYLPWFSATLVAGALAARIGLTQTIVIILSSCALLALVLSVVMWCASENHPFARLPAPADERGFDFESGISTVLGRSADAR